MKAFAEVPREYYRCNYQRKTSSAFKAYEPKTEDVKSHVIGYGSTLSDYFVQAYMTQIARPKPGDVVLEIGTGGGYQVSILSPIVKQAYSIEIIEPLGQGVAKIFKPLGYNNIRPASAWFLRLAGGEGRLRHHHRHLRRPDVPPALLEQLQARRPPRLSPPASRSRPAVGSCTSTPGCGGRRCHSRKYTSVYFIPMTGEMQKKPAGES